MAEALINPPVFFARVTIRILVDIFPIGRHIGPDQKIKALNEPIAAGAAVIRAMNVLRNPGWLGIAQHPDADRLDMNVTASDGIEGVGLNAGPAAQAESFSDTFVLRA